MFTTDLDLTCILTEDDLGNAPQVPPGKYHVLVTDVKESGKDDKTPFILLKQRVLNGTDQHAVGMTIEDRVFLTAGAIKRVALVALRLGLISRADLGKNVRVDWSKAKGRELIVEVDTEEYTTKDGAKRTKSKVTFGGVWDVQHPDAQDVPRGNPASVPAASGNGRPAAPAAAPADDFSDV